MVRSLMQVYLKGSVEAVALYHKAFNAQPGSNLYTNPDGTYAHAEIDMYGQILAVSELDECTAGRNMQFCLHFEADEQDKVTHAYGVLSEGARHIDCPPGPCEFSPCMASFVDKFGVYWCLFTN